MKDFFVRSVASLIFIISWSTPLLAQERGVLPDGRPFRTDAQGNQLVDYIAELELAIESLSRQVSGLEQEVEQKNIEIERLASVNRHSTNYRSGSLAHQDDLRERDLIGRRDNAFSLASNEKEAAACPACPELNCPSQDCPKDEWLAEKRRLENNLASLQNDLKRAGPQDASARLASLKEELEISRAQSASLLDRLDKSSAESESLRQELARREIEVGEMKLALASARASLERSSSATVTRTTPQSQEAPARVAAVQSREASSSSPQMVALQSRKENLIRESEQIKALIKRRDAMFNTYRASGAPVGFSPANPVSSRNSTLEQLVSRTERATHPNHLYSVAHEIREIRQRVQDDIALIERMGRLRQ